MNKKSVYYLFLKLRRFCYIFVCAFIPSKQIRHKVRERFVLYDKDIYFKLPFFKL